ncbi:hypothetical protein KO500_16610 [Cellulophaga baltica]|uniref:hypothetical protein n=1 Tax=Cellulophaga TaxID=104264 RepID=UPI001C0696B5|nr:MULTISPECIES: hypothetical protein [Cellulophaga]MBU2998065.1 hypothetical protein [Cellulophaga baltica]MDO6769467.1 hypothetical protein [Cellulophaga sp. 1_MG-2023]
MRNFLKFTAVVALMLCTTAVMADEMKENLKATKNAKSLIFELSEISNNTNIQFMDSDNHVIYSSYASSKKGFRKKFDLSKLSEGVYTFKLDGAIKTVTYTVALDAEGVTVIDKVEYTKPVFTQRGNIVLVNLLNDTKEGVSINVYDSSDRLLFTEEVADSLTFEKAIDFGTAFEGEYTVTVKDAHGVYSTIVTK